MKLKAFIVIFVAVLLIQFTHASTLGMSPPQVNFEGLSNQSICENFSVKYLGNNSLVGKLLWEKQGKFNRNLLEHNLSSKDLGINSSFERIISNNNASTHEICLSFPYSGEFHGVLIYKIENKPVQVGIWIGASIKGSKSSPLFVLGNFVKQSRINSFEFLNIVFFVLLTMVFVLLLWFNKKR